MFEMYVDKPFTKENLDNCLKELAKKFRKKNGTRMPAEIILIGGASILINYGFSCFWNFEYCGICSNDYFDSN